MTLPLGTIIKGDALEVLRGLPGGSVHCCVTSPPYWGMRNYEADGESLTGQYGREGTVEEHLAVLVEVFRELRRVLRADGTLWVNYGDKFAGSGLGGNPPDSPHQKQATNRGSLIEGAGTPAGYKPKDLLLLPFRLALALQADGWWVRQTIIWNKPNPMPESCRDRPSCAHEYMFLLAPAERYFYDHEAVREGKSGGAHARGNPGSQPYENAGNGHQNWHGSMTPQGDAQGGRNLRSVWTIPTFPYSGAHYATYPPALVGPCIKAGTSERGACPACGAPWERVVEQTRTPRGDNFGRRLVGPHDHGQAGSRFMETTVTILGWKPGCSCDAGEPVPCVVLDPFAGSGTTGVVAYRLGREFVGIDLAGGDADMGGHTAHDRINAAREGGRDVAEHVALERAGQMDLLREGP